MTVIETSPTQASRNIAWKQFACVLVGVWLATLVRFPVQPVIHGVSPFLFYLPVVVIISVVCGPKFGLLATIISVPPANYFWMPPEGTFTLGLTECCQILGFSIVGCSVSWLSHAARRRKELEEHLRATLACMGDAVITTDCEARIIYLNGMAQLLTELQGQKPVGRTLGSTLNLLAEDGRQMLNGAFQVAINSDDLEALPKRLIIVSESGRKYHVEQKTSRILDPAGRKIGTAILFHQLEAELALAPISKKPEDPLNARSELPRIAMVSTHGYVAAQPPLGAADTGGQVVYVLEMSRKLAQLGYEVDIWTRQFEDQPAIEPVNEHVRIIRVPCGGRNFIPKEFLCDSLPQWNENATAFIGKHRLNYQFVNSHYWDGGLAGAQLSKVLGVPHIHTPHSLGVWKKRQAEADHPGNEAQFDEKYNFSRRIQDERMLYASADVVVATSAEQVSILSSAYGVPEEKCRMIPPGYDDTRFFAVSEASREAIRKRLGFTTPVVQAIGRLADNKGYELLIKAFAVVARRMPEAVLQLAVGGANLNEQEVEIFARLKALAGELDLTDRVQFRGYIPDDQLPDYYRAADVFVLSSRYEPFGMTAVEAMACGTPTVLTVHGGLYQTVNFGQHGLYADPFDPEDLGMMIFKVLKHPRLRLQLSRMGAEKARSMFTWTGVAQQFLGLVECKNAARSTGAQSRELSSDAD